METLYRIYTVKEDRRDSDGKEWTRYRYRSIVGKTNNEPKGQVEWSE